MEEEPAKSDGRIEQVWFAGAHSNVGGGYPKQGMSLVALDWMLREARADAELRFLDGGSRRTTATHANVDDKLYNPRAGLGMFYRWKPRDIAALCQEAQSHACCTSERARARRARHRGLRPGNIPDEAVLVNSVVSPLLEERARKLEGVLSTTSTNKLPSVRVAILVGFLSYYVFIGSPVVLLIAVLASWLSWWNALVWLIVAETSALVLSLGADGAMSASFSEFWHDLQPELRLALKQARADMTRPPVPQPGGVLGEHLPRAEPVDATEIGTDSPARSRSIGSSPV